jgi:hypothetical protein
MANNDHLALLRQGRYVWNQWRKQNPNVIPQLSEANLREIDLREWDGLRINLSNANLEKADLTHAQLQEVNLQYANLQKANLTAANFRRADIRGTDFTGANIKETNFEEVNWNEHTIWRDLKNKKRAICSLDDIPRDLLHNENQFALEDYVIVNGMKTSITFEAAKKEIQKDIARRFNRKGQYKFRKDLLEAYNGRCAITGCEIEEALEAAHIIPYCLTKNNTVLNGLLLRADLHTLFDFNLILVDPDTRIIYLSRQLQHSHIYCYLHRQSSVLPPKSTNYQPWINALRWRHNNYQNYLDKNHQEVLDW